MKEYGLIGYPLGHSFSKKYFTAKFEDENITGCRYRLFPIENITLLPKLIADNPCLIGLNVTIPYKEQVLSYLDELDDTAGSIKAVNCIRISRNGEKYLLKGFNTDCFGFENSLLPLLKPHHEKALILGTGGASKAVGYVLKKHGIEYRYVSRTAREGVFGYNQLSGEIIDQYKLVVNGSPIGMSPDVDRAPDIPYEFISEYHLLYDLVYNPETTLFMKKGMDKGATVINGLAMLHGQAEKAWEIWNV